jgi:HK97 family phage major capsid protein/HK97 family phage prohead protease
MKIGKQFRALSATFEKAPPESPDNLEFSFSSEAPVSRFFGIEILSHDRGAADLSRLNDGANLLWNHNRDDVIGVVEKAWLGSDKRAYSKVRWGTSQKAQEIRKDVEAGIIRNVSFGYQIDEMKLLNPSEKDAESKYLATRWSPYEVSFVSIPADQTVGIGRAEEGSEIEVVIVKEEVPGPVTVDVPEKVEQDKPLEGDKSMDIEIMKKEAMEAERTRAAAINAMGEKFEKRDLARQLVEGGKSIDEARSAFLESIGSNYKPVTQREAEIGLSSKEVGQFSFMRAITALMNPNDKRAQEAAKFEFEVSRAAQDKNGKSAQGILVPFDVLNSKRDMVVGTSTAGGNLVATEELGSQYIDVLRKSAVVMAAGAKMLSGLKGSVAIPRMTAASTAYWIAESGAPTESAPAFDQVTMQPKGVGAFVDYSRKLMLQSSVDVEGLIRDDLMKVIALEIDRAAFYGLGASGEPLGLKNHSGVNSKSISSAGAPTFAEIVDMETKVATANALAGNLKYVVNAAGRGSLKSTAKVSGQPIYIMENGQVNGYEALVSNQVVTNDFWFGDFSQLILGFWSGLDLMIDPYAGSTSGTVRVIALQDMDVGVRHPESFTLGA